MAFTYTLVTDTFTRANSGTLGSNWTTISGATDTGTLGITSNAATPTANSVRAAALWNANAFTNDQWAEVLATPSGGVNTGNNAFYGVCLRAASNDTFYGLQMNFGTTASGLNIFKVVSGTFTSLTVATWATGTNPYLMRGEVTGTTINMYLNGVLALTATDSSIASGSAGVWAFNIAASHIALTNWRGGDIVWTRQGTVMNFNAPGTSGTGTQEPTVIYEGNAQILSGNVFKMWYTNGWTSANIQYAESSDGITWTQYGSNPVIGTTSTAHGFVFHHTNGTYYAYMGNSVASPPSQFDQYTSSNGVSWTLAHSAVLSKGVSGWDSGGIFNPRVWVEGSTWYMLYVGNNGSLDLIGLATSPDGVTWTKSVSNPVLTNGAGSLGTGLPVKINGVYYMIGHGSPSGLLPSDVLQYSSTDLITWTGISKNPIVERVLSDEGANLAAGQLADPCLVEVAGTTYLFNDATNAQASGHIHINLRTTPHTIAAFVGATITGGQVGAFCVGP
jgi:predicted GH43/DUF377 family glycosyl hydrolase